VPARPAVAVVGPGADVAPDLLTAAEEIGHGIAAAGYLVVTGGLGGVMAAAARGARAAGGTAVGLLPGSDAADADEAMHVVVPTGLGELRNVLVVRASELLVSVGGSWGTLSEVALARRLGKPVVSLHGWRVDGPAAEDDVVVVTSAADAVRAAVSLLASPPA
jgi:uncharacterized protein (TIGR00725 family)